MEWYLLHRLVVGPSKYMREPRVYCRSAYDRPWIQVSPCCPDPTRWPLGRGHIQIFLLLFFKKFSHQYLKIKRFHTCTKIRFSSSLENLWRAGNTDQHPHLEIIIWRKQVAYCPSLLPSLELKDNFETKITITTLIQI